MVRLAINVNLFLCWNNQVALCTFDPQTCVNPLKVTANCPDCRSKQIPEDALIAEFTSERLTAEMT